MRGVNKVILVGNATRHAELRHAVGTDPRVAPLWWALALGACLGGNGSLFVANLAFGSAGEADLLTAAKLGILAASAIAGAVGWVVLARWSVAGSPRPGGERRPVRAG